MTHRRLSIFLGLISLAISLATWSLDLSHLVINCIYCRNERTIIGLLGILLLLPIYPYITSYLSLAFGFYGASVCAQHIMLIMKNSHFTSPQLPLAIAALLIIIGQLFFIFNYLYGRSILKAINSNL
ncbi:MULTISPECIES: hypothetical protein [Legionella]|uniref:Disulfide bond formation protein B n=1 Tax=Legionella drozanskii LLAP-1 TaxID=1212489 RepID=A0A0W0SWJ0_9GAMM|nr:MULTISPECIES: hypothetical protein [Legionella]KTC87704.1 hypothetical protein Ldro_1323 [Legionella drozanskii LLAP-1]